MCFAVRLWHASPECFTDFDFNRVGQTSLKYGFGIYFSRDKQTARRHVQNAAYLYRVDLSRANYKRLLRMTEQLDKQCEEVKKLGETLKDNEPLSRWAAQGILKADGISLYKAACAYAGGSTQGIEYEKLGAKYLVNNGVLGAVTKDNSEEVITLYCPTIAKIAKSQKL